MCKFCAKSGFRTYHVIGIFSVKSSAVKLPSVVSNAIFVAIVNKLGPRLVMLRLQLLRTPVNSETGVWFSKNVKLRVPDNTALHFRPIKRDVAGNPCFVNEFAFFARRAIIE